MVHKKELVQRNELARGKIGETMLSIFMNHKYSRMRKIKKIVCEREREDTIGYIPLELLLQMVLIVAVG